MSASSPVSDLSLCTPPRIKITKDTGAAEILAAFSSRHRPVSPVQLPRNMIELGRDLRQKTAVTYNITDESDTLGPSSASPSVFSSPEKLKPQKRRSIKVIDLDESDSDVEEIEVPKIPPPRVTSAGHSLRQHKELSISLKALENADKPRKRARVSKTPRGPAKPRLSGTAGESRTGTRTARNKVRDTIASETVSRRSAFFVAKKDYFLPLLPANNHISKLAKQQPQVRDAIVDYEEITTQPKGVKATMKPYQLAGLSFLIHLQRNGLSGILGDEMGLGKTLQTLSLIQYMKESQDRSGAGAQPRPCLVVCPLSVLSSWMAEASKWTPNLNVLRFHGPIHERNRVKKVAVGEEDKFGNDTRQTILKKNKRLTAAGKDIINLESESENETASAGVDIVITTYETFAAEQGWFKRAFVWKYVILDEGHKIKNELTNLSATLQGLGAEYRLILTGTPLQNNLKELWALLHWLYPDVFTKITSEIFKSSFDLSRGKISTTVMDDARRLLELIMLRRMKKSPGVELNLPPKTDILLFVPLTPLQRFWYTRLLTNTDQGLLDELFRDAKGKEAVAMKEEAESDSSEDNKTSVKLENFEMGGGKQADWEESKEILRHALEQEGIDEGKSSAWKKLMNLLMQLRKCCNHPYLFPHVSPEPYYLGDHIVRASGKFLVLDKIVNELVMKQKKKILIFSGFTKMLDYCEDFLSFKSGNGEHFKYGRLDGATGRARRNLGIRMFNDRDSEYRVMLISTRAGGLGINLATASDVVLLDQDWNPQITLQAEARAHRIGQTQPVTVYKLCTQGTVEEQMMGRIQKKLYLSAKVTELMRNIHGPKTAKKQAAKGSTATADDMPQLGASQLMSLVRRGAQALSHPEINVDEMIDWDWDTMLAKCKDRPADVRVSEQTQASTIVKEEDEKEWLAKMEVIESRVFQGKKWATKKNSGKFDSMPHVSSRAQRREDKNTTVMVNGFAVSKESMRCADWEAVPTMAGKDPRLAGPIREKKAAIVNQQQCQVCWDGGELVLCSGCPRSYHYQCLNEDFKAKAGSTSQFYCPQHECVDCLQKTNDAGGMIYRCRWCERGYCEDCIDWDKTKLLGESLQEFEMLGFPANTQAFFVRCSQCTDHFQESPGSKEFCSKMANEYESQYRRMMDIESLAEVKDESANSAFSRAESLTDATTLNDSGITTPFREACRSVGSSSSRKRKATPESITVPSAKRLIELGL